MMRYQWFAGFLLTGFTIFLTDLHAQSALRAGPMIGYVEHREVLIWLEVAPEVDRVEIWYRREGSNNAAIKKYEGVLHQTFNPVKIILDGLDMNTTYSYEVLLDGVPVMTPFSTIFKTKELWEYRKDAPDFSFLFGSCFYINDSLYDRPGKPYGIEPDILERMADVPTDFMIWGGDNLYLREADYSSGYGIRYRYNYNFSIPQIQRLRASRANYAIWDDHDFGSNNSSRTFELKDIALQTFREYWGNKTFGEPGNEGAYTKFGWSDVEFFLLDNRYYRDANELPDSIGRSPNPDKRHLGRTQMAWLKNALISSNAVFKFIVIGGQILNPLNQHEGWMHYPVESADLLAFIRDNKINGVVFLTGDRHFTELQRYTPKDGYPLYDLTCSPVSSGAYDISKSPEFNNPGRVDGTLFMKQNFAKISVSGKKNERQLLFEIMDVSGTKVWDYRILQQELKF